MINFLRNINENIKKMSDNVDQKLRKQELLASYKLELHREAKMIEFGMRVGKAKARLEKMMDEDPQMAAYMNEVEMPERESAVELDHSSMHAPEFCISFNQIESDIIEDIRAEVKELSDQRLALINRTHQTLKNDQYLYRGFIEALQDIKANYLIEIFKKN
ncbi:hypothetical protein [Wohlfahrtiimonas chitiniclastica]|uniref:hypothetical protein n=1 Tax=Wohlfahrtiimonas chitiniclastica TaxID=400946 RepID=UPI0012DC1B9B|nr:hypothetical protein [Wohlfahrtiimonas chitiniclastica]